MTKFTQTALSELALHNDIQANNIQHYILVYKDTAECHSAKVIQYNDTQINHALYNDMQTLNGIQANNNLHNNIQPINIMYNGISQWHSV